MNGSGDGYGYGYGSGYGYGYGYGKVYWPEEYCSHEDCLNHPTPDRL